MCLIHDKYPSPCPLCACACIVVTATSFLRAHSLFSPTKPLLKYLQIPELSLFLVTYSTTNVIYVNSNKLQHA